MWSAKQCLYFTEIRSDVQIGGVLTGDRGLGIGDRDKQRIATCNLQRVLVSTIFAFCPLPSLSLCANCQLLSAIRSLPQFDPSSICGIISQQFNSSNLRLSREVEGTAL